jgi:hypothetical protein
VDNYEELFPVFKALSNKPNLLKDIRFTTLDTFKEQVKSMLSQIQEPFRTLQSSFSIFGVTQDYIQSLASQINQIEDSFLRSAFLHPSWKQIAGPLSSVTSVTESLKANAFASYFDSNYKLSLAEQIRLSIDFNLFEGPENIVNELADNVRFYDRELLSNLNRFYESQKSVQHTLQLPTFVLPQTSREVFLHAYCLRSIISNEDHLAVEEEKLIEVILEENKECVHLLQQVHPGLIVPYRGAYEAFQKTNTDRIRHILSSLRELWNHLLRTLAPNKEVLLWISNESEEYLSNGKPTKRARLMYICRNINNEPLSDFVDSDVKASLKFIDTLNRVHQIDCPFTEEQLRALLIRSDSIIIFLINLWRGP